MIDKDFNSREAFNEVIDNLEIIAHLTDYGKKLIKQGVIDLRYDYIRLQQENQQLKDKLSKIETLIINHNCDTGDIYYKYNSRFLKSELKQRIMEILQDKEVSE